jgi:hypothetical protein
MMVGGCWVWQYRGDCCCHPETPPCGQRCADCTPSAPSSKCTKYRARRGLAGGLLVSSRSVAMWVWDSASPHPHPHLAGRRTSSKCSNKKYARNGRARPPRHTETQARLVRRRCSPVATNRHASAPGSTTLPVCCRCCSERSRRLPPPPPRIISAQQSNVAKSESATSL